MLRSIHTVYFIYGVVTTCGLWGSGAVATAGRTPGGDAGLTIQSDRSDQSSPRRNILQGETVHGPRFPYAVSIRQASGAHLCSGALISKEWVLTAARCWQAIFDYPLVYIGVQDAGPSAIRREVRLARRMVPELGSVIDGTSLGLIQLNASVDTPVPRLSSKPAEPLEKSEVIGFGNKGGGNTELFAGMKVESHVIQRTKACQKKWDPSELGDTGFCMLNDDGLSSCIADSGSPVIRPSSGGGPSLDPLIGIVTGGGECGFDEDKPETIAVDVHENADWILSHIQQVQQASAFEKHKLIFLISAVVAVFVVTILVAAGGRYLKLNWRRMFPPAEPPEPWLVVEDSAKLHEGSELKGGEKTKSPFKNKLTSRTPPRDGAFPVISRSLRATRLYSSRKIIDSGQFGCVEKGQFVDAAGVTRDVAVKVARLAVGADPSHVSDTFLAEIECFERIPVHPNIIQCYGGCLGVGSLTDSAMECNEIFIVEELMDMNLRDIITGKHTPWETWTYKTVLHIFKNIAQGLEHLHAHNVSHYDLKPENVLVRVVDEVFPLQIKLADFGCSQIKQKTYATAKYAGTKHYMAPEIAWSPYYSLTASGKIDVYSLGILMWEVLTGDNLTPRAVQTVDDDGQMITIERALDCPEQLWPIAGHHPAELAKLIWSCVEFHSSKRPTTKMVIAAVDHLMDAAWVKDEVLREGSVIDVPSS